MKSKIIFQASEFLMFGCLMLLDMALLAYLAYNYTYVKIVDKSDDDQTSNNNANMDNIPLEEKPSTAKDE